MKPQEFTQQQIERYRQMTGEETVVDRGGRGGEKAGQGSHPAENGCDLKEMLARRSAIPRNRTEFPRLGRDPLAQGWIGVQVG